VAQLLIRSAENFNVVKRPQHVLDHMIARYWTAFPSTVYMEWQCDNVTVVSFSVLKSWHIDQLFYKMEVTFQFFSASTVTIWHPASYFV